MPELLDKDELKKLNTKQKKELLDHLLSSLLTDLGSEDRKDLFRKLVSGSGENLQVIDMVEH